MNWYSDRRVAFIRSKVKPQSSWLLHLAGDHHQNFETKPLLHGQHMMRCMLTANLAVDRACFHVDSSTAVVRQACGRTIKQKQDQRFANGTQGRLLHWSPSDAAVEGSKKAVPASHPGLCARFVKETALQQTGALLPDIDMVPRSCHS